MKFKTIIGGTEAEALVKFHWLAEADFDDAVIDITYNYPVWKNGFWKNGTWKYGIWKYGTWKNGTWKNGFWKNGTWENGFWKDGFWRGGRMWSNANQIYEIVEYKDGKFTVIS